MSESGLLSIGEVNELDLDQFIWLFGGIIEKTPDAASYVYNKKPFQSATHIISLFNKYLDSRTNEEQENVLRSYPDIGTKMKTTLTAESSKEQESIGMNDLDENDQKILLDNNTRYSEKFGFPFILCARENTASSLFEMIQKRVEGERQTEMKTGIEEVKKILKHRVLDLVWHD